MIDKTFLYPVAVWATNFLFIAIALCINGLWLAADLKELNVD